jgi:hydroxymethylglutaryl-CoA lyase
MERHSGPPRGEAVVCECWARDGLQSMPVLVPTARKIEMIDRIVDAGFRKLEVTSFSNRKLLPQFADAEDVLRGIRRRPGVSHVVLMPNERGFERFQACVEDGFGAEEIILMISASERHNVLNFRMTHGDAMREHDRIMRRARGLGVRVIGCAGTVYGCPVGGDVPLRDVEKIVAFYLDHGAHTIMLGDTTGMANPVLVRERIGALRARFPTAAFIAHFHDTRGTGIVNSVAAIELGLRYVDTSLGAIGGQPATGAAKYSAGFTGNTCTEDLVALLEEMGVRTGIDVERLIAAGRRGEEILGQRLRSNVIRSGPVVHTESAADKEPGCAATARA